MKLTSKDISAIRLPALALVIAIAVSVGLVQLSSAKLQQAESQQRSQSVALQQARSRYHQSGEERETILRYLATYQQLEQQGLIGSEQRIEWLEGLRAANTEAGLFGVEYQIAARTSFPYLSKEHPAAQQVHHSPMRVTLGLLHEGDLMRFFRALSAQRAGTFALTSCAVDRGGRTGTPQPRQANLTAQCELSWLTIDPRKADQ
jgi:hypothetical protein